jgi:hypothetical protein
MSALKHLFLIHFVRGVLVFGIHVHYKYGLCYTHVYVYIYVHVLSLSRHEGLISGRRPSGLSLTLIKTCEYSCVIIRMLKAR